MKQIALTQNQYATVSDKDYEKVNQFKWCYDSHNRCAVRGVKTNGKNKIIFMHRFIMDTPVGLVTDHINGNRLDNRQENLRICKNFENQRNMNMHKDNTTGYKGVYFTGQKWYSKIANKHIGTFNTKLEAAIAYNIAAKKVFGNFAKINVLGDN